MQISTYTQQISQRVSSSSESDSVSSTLPCSISMTALLLFGARDLLRDPKLASSFGVVRLDVLELVFEILDSNHFFLPVIVPIEVRTTALWWL